MNFIQCASLSSLDILPVALSLSPGNDEVEQRGHTLPASTCLCSCRTSNAMESEKKFGHNWMLTLEIVLVDLTHWYINSVNSMALCDAAAVAIVPLMLCKCFTMNTEYSSFSRQIWFFSNHILWEVFFYFWASPLTTMDAVFASFSCSMWWRHMIAGLVWAPSVCSCCRFNQTDFIYSNMWRENKIEEKKRNRNQSTFKGVGKLSALQVCAHWVECRIHIEHSAPSFAIRHVSSSAPLSILRAHMTVNLHAEIEMEVPLLRQP